MKATNPTNFGLVDWSRGGRRTRRDNPRASGVRTSQMGSQPLPGEPSQSEDLGQLLGRDSLEQFPSGSSAQDPSSARGKVLNFPDVRKANIEIAVAAHEHAIGAAIERSKAFVARYHDAGDPDAVQLPSDLSWRRALQFLVVQSRLTRHRFHQFLDIPLISVADQGSIDLYWKNDERTLLINIPASPSAPASYYGQSHTGTATMGGSVDTDEFVPALAVWLIAPQV